MGKECETRQCEKRVGEQSHVYFGPHEKGGVTSVLWVALLQLAVHETVTRPHSLTRLNQHASNRQLLVMSPS